jgi:hypothetical protein
MYPPMGKGKNIQTSYVQFKRYRLIKCAILPPRKLYHPVSPLKNKVEDKSGAEKLIFPVCRLCAKLNKNIKELSEEYGVQMKYKKL